MKLSDWRPSFLWPPGFEMSAAKRDTRLIDIDEEEANDFS
jgi:hypothetical protein